MSKPIGIYEAKTHFSQIVDDLVNGRCGPVPIMRHGKQAVYLVTELPAATTPTKPKSIIGCMKGLIGDIDLKDTELTEEEIDELFGEKRDIEKEKRISW
jgi:hypothetical protein